MNCPPLATVAAWSLDELDRSQTEAFEEHYFTCDACFSRADRMHRLIADLGALLPPILTRDRRQKLEGTMPSLTEVDVRPGERASIQLGRSAEVGLWIIHAPLEHAARVDFEARSADGGLLFALTDVPFDRVRGEVVLACQLHYRANPRTQEMHVALNVSSPDGARPVGPYILLHTYDSL